MIGAVLRRSVARRLGRLRACGAGLSEARRRGDRLARATRRQALDRRLMVRLVKGAYWDTEIKRAQERGLADYPVFTRKAMTDLCYLACAGKLLAARPRLYPQFATHNALTVASVIEDGRRRRGLRIPAPARHGRGALRGAAGRRAGAPPAGSMRRSAAIAICSPIWCGGCWRTAPTPPSSRSRPIRTCRSRRSSSGRRPGSATPAHARHPRIPLPRDLYRPARRNSAGRRIRRPRGARRAAGRDRASAPRDGAGRAADRRRGTAGRSRPVLSPIDGSAVGQVAEGDAATGRCAMAAAQAGFAAWAATPVEQRAGALERAADLLEAARGRLIALLQTEGGKTLDDALSEVREAVDFCRYYAARGAARAGAAADAGADRRDRTNCAIAAAACSSASARGIFRWRSSSARSPRRSPPATRWWRSPPSRRR